MLEPRTVAVAAPFSAEALFVGSHHDPTRRVTRAVDCRHPHRRTPPLRPRDGGV